MQGVFGACGVSLNHLKEAWNQYRLHLAEVAIYWTMRVYPVCPQRDEFCRFALTYALRRKAELKATGRWLLG